MKLWTKATGRSTSRTARRLVPTMMLMAVLAPGLFLAGCSDDDCLNCPNLAPPVVPTGVKSISGDGYVIVQWNDLVYYPYDGRYNENLVAYEVYRRQYQFGDEDIEDRTFDPDPIAIVAWDDANFDVNSGVRWCVDEEVVNGLQYEYAVASVNAEGARSALSYEFVADAPLPMSPLDNQGWYIPLGLFDRNTSSATGYGFVFARAAALPATLTGGRVTPGIEVAVADIEVFFSGGIPYVTEGGPQTRLQDLGDFSDGAGHVLFEGVGWAPVNGYSVAGTLELLAGHVYAVELTVAPGRLHFAKFGVTSVGAGVVNIIWAYQTIENLPELAVPAPVPGDGADGPQFISL